MAVDPTGGPIVAPRTGFGLNDPNLTQPTDDETGRRIEAENQDLRARFGSEHNMLGLPETWFRPTVHKDSTANMRANFFAGATAGLARSLYLGTCCDQKGNFSFGKFFGSTAKMAAANYMFSIPVVGPLAMIGFGLHGLWYSVPAAIDHYSNMIADKNHHNNEAAAVQAYDSGQEAAKAALDTVMVIGGSASEELPETLSPPTGSHTGLDRGIHTVARVISKPIRSFSPRNLLNALKKTQEVLGDGCRGGAGRPDVDFSEGMSNLGLDVTKRGLKGMLPRRGDARVVHSPGVSGNPTFEITGTTSGGVNGWMPTWLKLTPTLSVKSEDSTNPRLSINVPSFYAGQMDTPAGSAPDTSGAKNVPFDNNAWHQFGSMAYPPTMLGMNGMGEMGGYPGMGMGGMGLEGSGGLGGYPETGGMPYNGVPVSGGSGVGAYPPLEPLPPIDTEASLNLNGAAPITGNTTPTATQQPTPQARGSLPIGSATTTPTPLPGASTSTTPPVKGSLPITTTPGATGTPTAPTTNPSKGSLPIGGQSSSTQTSAPISGLTLPTMTVDPTGYGLGNVVIPDLPALQNFTLQAPPAGAGAGH